MSARSARLEGLLVKPFETRFALLRANGDYTSSELNLLALETNITGISLIMA
jgi:hypothetical protein